MFQQMFQQLNQPRTNTATNTTSSATTSTGASTTTTSGTTAGNVPSATPAPGQNRPPPPAFGAMMNQMLQAMNNPQNASQPITNIINSIAPANNAEEEGGVISAVLQLILEHLTMPDMIAIFGGNWAPLTNIHPVLLNYVRDHLLHGNISEENIAQLVDEILDSQRQNLTIQSLPQELRSHIIGGQDVITISLTSFRVHLIRLVHLILEVQQAQFVSNLQEWMSTFCGEWVSIVAVCFTGGVNDVVALVRHIIPRWLPLLDLQELAFFIPTIANLITNYVLRNYNEYVARQRTQQSTQQWQQTIPQELRDQWASTISLDQIRQTNSPPQHPFSDAYLSGVPAKRRKIDKYNRVAAPGDILQTILHESINTANVKPQTPSNTTSTTSNTTTTTTTSTATTNATSNNNEITNNDIVDILISPYNNLVDLFVQQLSEDFNRRLQNDPDFQVAQQSRYPNTQNLFKHHASS